MPAAFLQGEFNGGEPVAAVMAWVADALADPLQTFDLVTPSRQLLDHGAGSVADAGLLPSATLNFRWVGAGSAGSPPCAGPSQAWGLR